MSAALINPWACACCEVGATPMSPSIALAAKRGTAWANGSELGLDDWDMVDAKGYDPADFDGFWRTIELTEVYPIKDTTTPGTFGSWTRVSTVAHSGANVVATAAEITFTESVVEDADPTPPLYVDETALDVAASDIVATTEIPASDVRSFAVTQADAQDWADAGSVPTTELDGWSSGVYQTAAGGHAVAIKMRYALSWIYDTYEPSTDIITTALGDGDLSLPIAYRIDSYTVATTTTNPGAVTRTSVPWDAAQKLFVTVDADLTDPESAGWTALAFDATGATWYGFHLFDGVADLWPVIIGESA